MLIDIVISFQETINWEFIPFTRYYITVAMEFHRSQEEEHWNMILILWCNFLLLTISFPSCTHNWSSSSKRMQESDPQKVHQPGTHNEYFPQCPHFHPLLLILSTSLQLCASDCQVKKKNRKKEWMNIFLGEILLWNANQCNYTAFWLAWHGYWGQKRIGMHLIKLCFNISILPPFLPYGKVFS